MGRKFFSLGFFVILYTSVFNRAGCKITKEKDYIVWQEGKKLKWNDFYNNEFIGIGITAASSVKIKFTYEVDNYLKWFTVECIFLKNESTARSDKTDYVLNHEQGHFNIGEIFARRLRKRILEIRNTISKKNYLNLDSIYHLYTKMMVEGQECYDKETDFSNDSLQQRIWDKKIRKSLDSLRTYQFRKY